MKKKILMIEDEALLIDLYKKSLENTGFEVVTAITGEEGVEVAKKEKPDIILLDIILPETDGVHFLEMKVKDKDISSIPVIVFSNLDTKETKDRVFELGALDYLIKSDLTPLQVTEKIQEHLEKSPSKIDS